MHVLLLGAGYMAKEYVKVLNAQNIDFTVVGRGKESATVFEQETGVEVLSGVLEVVYEQLQAQPTHAIVASTLESLEENALYLIENGIKYVLIEKPAALSSEGMQRILESAIKRGSNVYIAYNRRFYSSVIAAQRLIKEDGGLTSFVFEFTEWSHMIGSLNKTSAQLDNWFIGNSTHVIDMAFFFGGKPREMSNFVTSTLDWHPKGSIYAGAGVTEKDIFFSYHANWQAPGSWKLELLTTKNRYIFRPLEKLHVQRLGKVTVEEIGISDELDIEFKPGLYEQTNAFFNKTSLSGNLLSINEGLDIMKVYEKMNGGLK